MSSRTSINTVGIIGFGAFGRLMAAHLHPHVQLVICDPALCPQDPVRDHAHAGNAADAAGCDLVILAVPFRAMAQVLAEIAPRLRPGTIVMDVVSVKVEPVELMLQGLPGDVEIIGTHPLFGPQSAANGIQDLKIAICPVRGSSARRIGAFLRHALGLKVIFTSPAEHDRQLAVVQGLTHMIAKILVQMEPLPGQLTTTSFEKLMQSVDIVRHDSEDVFRTIERNNPFAEPMRQRFFEIADGVRGELERQRQSEPVPEAAPALLEPA